MLIDVWDFDALSHSDFMCYIELTLGELLYAAENMTPITLRPPPAPHKQTVGCLYVEHFRFGIPQVTHVRRRVCVRVRARVRACVCVFVCVSGTPQVR